MNRLDTFLLLFLNQFANHWHSLDWLVTRALHSNLVGAGVLVFLAWYALFDRQQPNHLRKGFELLLGSGLLSAVAVVTARGLALILPFRNRPIWTPDLHFQLPPLTEPLEPLRWSSFPSDHAVLYAIIVTGIFFVSRPLGWIALVWVALFGSFPQLYFGIHWPSDILAGAVLGVAFAQIPRIPVLRGALRELAAYGHRRQPGLFFALLFIGGYQIVSMFDDARRIAARLYHLVKNTAALHGTAGLGLAALGFILVGIAGIAIAAAIWRARRRRLVGRTSPREWTDPADRAAATVAAPSPAEREDQTV